MNQNISKSDQKKHVCQTERLKTVRRGNISIRHNLYCHDSLKGAGAFKLGQNLSRT